MKRTITAMTIAAAALGSIGGLTPAQAHAPTFQIAGFQYFWTTLVEDGGHANYIGTPVAPIPINQVGGLPFGNGPSLSPEEAIDSVQNVDRIAHTFTECTGGCDGTSPSSIGSVFDIALDPAQTKVFTLKPTKEWQDRTYVFFCTVYPFMRGSFEMNL